MAGVGELRAPPVASPHDPPHRSLLARVREHREQDHDRCVDLFSRPDGTFGFEEFRRHPEDGVLWTPTAYFSAASYESEGSARAAAGAAIPWLRTSSDTKPA